MADNLIGIAYLFDSLITILLTIILLPTIALSYPICQWSRKCWIRFVKWKYPQCIVVEERSTRIILDQGRNQGIYTMLVECPSIVTEHIRNHLIHLASTKPLLRMALTTKCCQYAWEKLENFSVDNHLIISPNLFKGRPITESNVQEYVSDLTSKYLAASHSPWQVQIIGKDQQLGRHCLVRVHHLLLSQEHLTLGDFLPLKRAHWLSCTGVSDPSFSSPFASIYTEPSALPRLHEKLTESFSNVWNEFLCNNDPTERPEILKSRISLWQCTKIVIIICFSTLKEITRRKEGVRLYEVWQVYTREARKRNFSWSLAIHAFLSFLNPAEIMRLVIVWIWYLTVCASLKAPIVFWREIRAVSFLHEHHYYPDSIISVLSCYLPLIFRASLEVVSILSVIVSAPFTIMEELFRNRGNDFRTVSQCGRKVVAWSEEIEMALLQKISAMNGASNAEILLSAAVDSLTEYFRCSGQPIPDEVLATAKFTSQNALYVGNCEPTGLLCLALPTKTSLSDEPNNLVGILQIIQRNIQEARRKQRAIYAITAAESASGFLTSCLPSIFLKIALNHLTRRYSISVTHVDGDLPVEGVHSAIFWKPPQGNCNLSITLHRHDKVVRLGVMGDAIIGPQHAAITRGFPGSLEKLARSLGIPTTSSSKSSSLCIPSRVISPTF